MRKRANFRYLHKSHIEKRSPICKGRQRKQKRVSSRRPERIIPFFTSLMTSNCSGPLSVRSVPSEIAASPEIPTHSNRETHTMRTPRPQPAWIHWREHNTARCVRFSEKCENCIFAMGGKHIDRVAGWRRGLQPPSAPLVLQLPPSQPLVLHTDQKLAYISKLHQTTTSRSRRVRKNAFQFKTYHIMALF